MACCWKPSALSETIIRWTIFGLTCLSWLFVVSSTATCSFISDSFYINVDYGLFCFKFGNQKGRYAGDLPGALIAAQLFATLACLIISATLIAVALVIFLLPGGHAVRAWWTARIMYCVALFCVFLTFSVSSDSLCEGNCDGSAGSALNGLNVVILIALITLSFLIMAPKKPLFDVFKASARPSIPAPPMEAPAREDLYDEEAKPNVVLPAATAPVQSHRIEEYSPEGNRIIRETVVHSDGRQEVTETMEEPSIIVPPRDQTFVATKEMTTPEGNRMTVETIKHSDGRQVVTETVEEPSLIDPRQDQTFVSLEETTTHEGNRMTVETTKHSDGRQEIVETVEEPSMIGGDMEEAVQQQREEIPITASQSRDPSLVGGGPVMPATKIVAEKDSSAPGNRRAADPPEN